MSGRKMSLSAERPMTILLPRIGMRLPGPDPVWSSISAMAALRAPSDVTPFTGRKGPGFRRTPPFCLRLGTGAVAAARGGAVERRWGGRWRCDGARGILGSLLPPMSESALSPHPAAAANDPGRDLEAVR